MLLSQDFQTSCDDLNLEQWVVPLNLVKHPMVNLELLLNSEMVAIIVNDHAEDVSQLNDENCLLDEYLAHLEQNLLKKLEVVVQL